MSTVEPRQETPSDAESGLVDAATGETTPLLSVSPSAVSLEIAKRDAAGPYLAVARKEARWMASSSSLTVLALLLEESFYFANVMSVGHLGATELAAMALSATCAAIIFLAPSCGLLSAMDTFCSTAFTASSDKTMVGFHLQRGLAALTAHFALVTPVMWNAERILLAIGQEPAVARLSGMYLRIQIFGVLPWAAFEACRRYLQAQGNMAAGTIITVVVAPVHWIANYLLVRSPTYGIGFVGAPIVTLVSDCLLLVGMLAYLGVKRTSETWGGWDVRVLRTMGEFYRLAIPSVITVCAEWLGIELLTLGSSYFGPTQLAGQAVMLNIVFLAFQVSNGIGFGTSPRVGNLIGAAKPRQARIAGDVSLAVSVVVGAACSLCLVVFGDGWIAIYTKDPAVAREAARLIPVTCTLLVCDGLNAVLGAVLRGLGRQASSANAFIFGFYGCAVPIGAYLGYGLGMRSLGLWTGLCIGIFIASAIQLMYVYVWVDWRDEVRQCVARLQRNGGGAAQDD